MFLQATLQAMREVAGGQDDNQAQLDAYWLMTTGWRVLRAFDVPASRERVTRWTVARLNVREAIIPRLRARRNA